MRHIFRAALLACSLSAPAAHALGSDDEDVVVTATRLRAPTASIPAEVDIIAADDARASGALTLDAALANIPGIQAARAGPIGQQASLFSGGFESNHTLVLFDGVRIDDPATPEGVFDAGQDLLGDVSRIEVVQGPMSALYGSGALGGVVNVIPRRGDADRSSLRMESAAGSFDSFTGSVGADGALGPLRFALTAGGYSSAGYDIVPRRIASYTGEPDGAETTTLTGVFDLTLDARFALDLLVRRRAAHADYDPGFFGDIAENSDAEIAQNDLNLWRLGGTWTLGDDATLRASGGALDTDRVATDFGAVSDEYHGERNFASLDATRRWRSWTLLTGLQWENESIGAVSFGAPIAGEAEHLGAYATAQGSFDGISIMGAVRYDDVDRFGGSATWRAGLAYAFGPRTRLYATSGTGYRAPSLYERFVPFFGTSALSPETARSWEVGGNTAVPMFGAANGIEVGALYRGSTIEDLIGFSGLSYANVDRADIQYAEARMAAHLLTWLTARVSYANTRAIDASTGDPLLRRPRHAWAATLQAERGPLTAEISWRETGARFDTVYEDSGVFAGTGRVAAYDVVRASASWRAGEGVRLYLAADNLLQAVYEPVNGFAGAPRSILIGVQVER